MRSTRTLLIAAFGLVGAAVLFAQGRNIGNEWPTSLGDAQRTNWMRVNPNISVDALSKPGFELQWKSPLDGARGLKPAVQGVTVNGVTLFTPLSIVTGGNGVIAIDNDTGATFWYKSFGAAPASAAGCAAPVAATRQAELVQPVPTAPRGGAGGGGRGGYSSNVGNPGEGAPLPPGRGGGGAPGRGAPEAAAPGAPAAPGAAPAPGAPGAAPGTPPAAAPGAPGGVPGAAAPGAAPGAAPARGGGGGFGRPSGVVYVIARDGMLHVVGLPSSKDIQKPAPFIPAGARAMDPLAVNDILYTSTTGRCGGTADAIYAMDLANASKPVVSYKTTGSPVGVVALTTDGTVVAVVTNGIVTLDAKTLAVKKSFTDANTTFATGPLVFSHGGKDMIGAGTKDGRILMIDAATLAAPVSTKVTPAGATLGADALAFFQEYSAPPPDPAAAAAAPPQGGGGRGFAGPPPVPMVPGQPWLLATTANAIVAFKIVDQGGAPALQAGWTSRSLVSPAAPLVVNNVVFGISSGKPAAAAGTGTPAVLYALNAMTGKDFWNSGTTIKSYMPGRALWTSNSQVYVGGNEGAIYAFGFPLERK